MLQIPPCPKCHLEKWATVPDPQNFRRTLTRCMECGFEVDTAVVERAEWILRRESGET